jgi:hypothetical protein
MNAKLTSARGFDILLSSGSIQIHRNEPASRLSDTRIDDEKLNQCRRVQTAGAEAMTDQGQDYRANQIYRRLTVQEPR